VSERRENKIEAPRVYAKDKKKSRFKRTRANMKLPASKKQISLAYWAVVTEEERTPVNGNNTIGSKAVTAMGTSTRSGFVVSFLYLK
jgi:hypothetical protein